MKKVVSFLCLMLSVATCAEQQELLAENQVQEIIFQTELANKSEDFLEKKPALNEVDFNPRKRPFDALDGFVDSLNDVESSIGITDLWITTAFIAAKFLYNENFCSFDYKKYIVLLMVSSGAWGILRLGAHCKYYVYRFVRGGIETIAPEKMVTGFNKLMISLEERFPYLTAFAGASCAIASYFAFGSQEKSAALGFVGSLFRPFFKAN